MKVLKFGAVWCPECLVMRPLWEEIEKEIPELKNSLWERFKQIIEIYLEGT